jgi:hypothetical protein
MLPGFLQLWIVKLVVLLEFILRIEFKFMVILLVGFIQRIVFRFFVGLIGEFQHFRVI